MSVVSTKYLFVGGPADGTYVEVPIDERVWIVSIVDPVEIQYSLGQLPPSVFIERYAYIHDILGGSHNGKDEFIPIFRYSKMTQFEALQAVLDHYGRKHEEKV